MNTPVSDLSVLLGSLQPVLNDGVFVYAMVPAGTALPAIDAIGMFREAEGVTLIASETEAAKAGLEAMLRAAWITLKVHSALQAVGLTAAFSRALGEAGISCNVIAAACHDHIFVSIEDAERAMACLRALQQVHAHEEK